MFARPGEAQTQPHADVHGQRVPLKYAGVLDAFARILRDEGPLVTFCNPAASQLDARDAGTPTQSFLRSSSLRRRRCGRVVSQAFWKGNSMALLLYMSYGALQFGTYYELKKLYGGYVRSCHACVCMHGQGLTRRA